MRTIDRLMREEKERQKKPVDKWKKENEREEI